MYESLSFLQTKVTKIYLSGGNISKKVINLTLSSTSNSLIHLHLHPCKLLCIPYCIIHFIYWTTCLHCNRKLFLQCSTKLVKYQNILSSPSYLCFILEGLRTICELVLHENFQFVIGIFNTLEAFSVNR